MKTRKFYSSESNSLSANAPTEDTIKEWTEGLQ